MRKVSIFLAAFSIANVAVAQDPPPAEAPPPAPLPEAAPEAAPPPPAPAETQGPGLGLPGPPTDAPVTPPPAEPAPAQPAVPPKMPPGAASPLKFTTPTATFRAGVLLQPQFESIGSQSPALDGMSNNLFLRRTRLLFGGTIFDTIEWFVDTDYPNLFKSGGEEGLKNTPGMNIQDAFGTVKVVEDMFKVDIGYMLPPLSHNAVQGATTLFGHDYFANSFRHSAAFGTTSDPIGRDAGVQLRGLVADGLLEYRAGIFQGRREAPTATEVGSQNFFRLAARVQLNFLDPEPGFFYAGTYLGTKQIASVGLSYDFQDSYKHVSGDGFVDLELGPGVLTAQVNVQYWDGDDWLAALPEQTALMGEVGYTFYAAKLSPIFRFEKRFAADPEGGATPTVFDETRVGGGIAFWPFTHNFNLKAFYTRIEPDQPNTEGFNQFNVQAQFFVF